MGIPSLPTMPNWKAVRAEFPALARWTYLNTATYGQMPRRATGAAMAHFAHRDELACADFLSWFDDADGIRANVATLIGATADDIAFAGSAADALAWLMGGIDWREGDRVVTLAGEFPNNLYYPATLATRGVEFIETEFDALREAVNDRTRLVLISTVNYVTGFRPELAGLSEWLRSRGTLLYVDGTQSLGALRFSIPEVRPDMFAVHGYKWLLSPNGAGFAYVSPELRRTLPPSVIGWRSDAGWREVDHLHHGAPRLSDKAERYEGGMLNFVNLYAMDASVRMFLELGPDVIEERVLGLAAQCRRTLQELGGTVLHDNTPVLAAQFPGTDPSILARRLREQGILVSARKGCLRVSVHFYNDESDLERLREGLASILRG